MQMCLHYQNQFRDGVNALALLSGGLDSSLAILITKKFGIRITALYFYTGFCRVEHKRRVGGRNKNEALDAAAKLHVPVEIVDISNEYFKMVLNPKYGYGSAANPCIDCRIYMLRKAKEIMMERNVQFIITGEVLGQRPMTQHLPTLRLIEKETGLSGKILRPLSAKLLPETLPEKMGWVSREQLYSIKGRSRKIQIKLAEQFGLVDYPQPAGGCCFLTDKNYAKRFFDYFEHQKSKQVSSDVITLLSIARHFRLSDKLKIIVGRNKNENEILSRFRNNFACCYAVDFVGPLVLIDGEYNEDEKKTIAAITAFYCDGRNQKNVAIVFENNGHKEIIETEPIEPNNLCKVKLIK